MTTYLSIILVIISTLLSSFGSFTLKIVSRTIDFHPRSLMKNFTLMGALSCHVLSSILSVIAYRSGELTILVPLGSLNYIWASMLAVRFLGERMNTHKWIGMVLIMAGVTLIGLGGLS